MSSYFCLNEKIPRVKSSFHFPNVLLSGIISAESRGSPIIPWRKLKIQPFPPEFNVGRRAGSPPPLHFFSTFVSDFVTDIKSILDFSSGGSSCKDPDNRRLNGKVIAARFDTNSGGCFWIY